MKEYIDKLVLNKTVTEMNIRFADFISDLCKDKNNVLYLMFIISSYWTECGHICLDLKDLNSENIQRIIKTSEVPFPDKKDLLKLLKSCTCIGEPGEKVPLILDGDRLYFERLFSREKDLIYKINKRIKTRIEFSGEEEKIILGIIKNLFPDSGGADMQGISVINTLYNYFSVISGGPGTGKTTTVIKILILLINLSLNGFLFKEKRKPNICLCAPTGKAAARLREAIENVKTSGGYPEDVLSCLPDDGYTIHRLIKKLSGKNILPPDILIIDEASMADLFILSGLFSIIPDTARIILLGDKDQLASVEAGAVLGDICCGTDTFAYSESHCINIKKYFKDFVNSGESNTPPIRNSIVLLNRNFRFKEKLLELSNAVRTGQPDKAVDILKIPDKLITWIDPEKNSSYRDILKDSLLSLYNSYIEEQDEEQALELFNSFRILCAIRKGPYGVETTNKWIEKILKDSGLISPYKQFYENRPVIITRNDYNLNLFNGDIGIIRKDRKSLKSLYAIFKEPSGSIKRISPYKLPEHETVFSMTVHKSQGSEFNRVILILPDNPSAVITRELIYTGITRTRSELIILSKEEVLRTGIVKSIKRTSGITDSLWRMNQ